MARRFSMDRGMALRSWPGRGCGLGTSRLGGRSVKPVTVGAGAGRRPVRGAAGERRRGALTPRGPPDQAGEPVNDRFSDLTDEAEPLAGAARDTFVPRPRAADTDRTPQSRADAVPDAGPVPDRARRAWDAAGDPALAARSPSDIPQAADPVDVATGDVLLFQDDVSLPGLLPLVIGRAYRSSWRAGRWFGPSWASSLDQRLQIAPDRITGVFADGRVLSWSCRSTEDGPVPLTGLPVTGPRWRLERTGGGAFMVTDPQAGLVWRFEGRGAELPLVSRDRPARRPDPVRLHRAG